MAQEEHSPAEKPGTGRAGGGLSRSAAQPQGRASLGAAGVPGASCSPALKALGMDTAQPHRAGQGQPGARLS